MLRQAGLMLLSVWAMSRAGVSSAQSLGDELVLSRLGDPVEVEISVQGWENLAMERVQIANATQQQYAAFGLTYLPILDQLNFNLVGPNRAGEVKVLISSREPVSEPFMDLLLVLRWPGGSTLREFVLLFDPPLPETAAPAISQAVPVAPVSAGNDERERAAFDAYVNQTAVDDGAAEEDAAPLVSDPMPTPPALEPEEPALPQALARAEVPVPVPVVEAPESIAASPPLRTPPAPVAETTAEPPVVAADAPPEPPALAQTPTTVVVVESAAVPPAAPVESAPPKPIEPTLPDVKTQTAIEVETLTPPVPPAADDVHRQYQVRGGDTLWVIARQFHPAGTGENLYQFLVSLHELNRQAFINGNISLLKSAATLRIPTAAEIAAINPSTAQAVFDQRWDEGTRRAEAAAKGLPLPAFSAINEPLSAAAEPTAPVPVPPPGVELADLAEPALIDTADTPVLAEAPVAGDPAPTGEAATPQSNAQDAPAVTVEVADVAAPRAIALIPDQATNAAPAEVSASAANPYLVSITAAATEIRDRLSLRQQRMQEIEQQIEQLRQQMEAAQQHLQAEASVVRQASGGQLWLYAGVVLLLLGALGFTVRLALRITADLRRLGV